MVIVCLTRPSLLTRGCLLCFPREKINLKENVTVLDKILHPGRFVWEGGSGLRPGGCC